jgi:outer membrane receptor protein involved in Fe transport
LKYSVKRRSAGNVAWKAGVGLLVLGSTALAQTTTPPSASHPGDDNQGNVVVVTGVLRDTTSDKAAISVTTIDEDRMRAVAPVSAADLLSEIPGVVVTSDAGEARNTVYARGISNGTSAGTVGYYWNAPTQPPGQCRLYAAARRRSPVPTRRPDCSTTSPRMA